MIEIVDGVYVGSKKSAKDRQKLRSLKIRSVINVSPSRDEDAAHGIPNYFEKTSSNVYLRIPALDQDETLFLDYLEEACDFITARLKHGSVLVHCDKGIVRSPAVVAAYLMRTMRLGPDQALELICSKRPQTQLNDIYMSQLQQYNEILLSKQEYSDKIPPSPSEDNRRRKLACDDDVSENQSNKRHRLGIQGE